VSDKNIFANKILRESEIFKIDLRSRMSEMEAATDWPNIYDAASDSSSAASIDSNKSISNSSNSTSSSKASNEMDVQEAMSSMSSSKEDSTQSSGRSLLLGPMSSTLALEDPDYPQSGPMLISPPADQSPDLSPHCTGCKSSSPAVANCFSCSALLCANCVIAHQLMLAFEGHHVTNLGQNSGKTAVDPTPGSGQGVNSLDGVKRMVKDARKKLNELQKTVKSVDYSSSRLTSQYDKAVAEVNETFNFYMSMLAERKLELVKELEKLYSSKQVALSVFGQKIHESSDKIEQHVGFMEKLIQSASTKDVLMFQASLETRLTHLVASLPQLDLASTVQLEFISNFQAIQVGVRNQFGYIKSGSSENTTMSKQPPIARPVNPSSLSSVFSQLSNSVMSGLTATSISTSPTQTMSNQVISKDLANNISASLDFQNNYMASTFSNQMENNGSSLSSSPLEFLENLSGGSTGAVSRTLETGGLQDFVSSITNSMAQSGLQPASLATPVPSAPIAYPPKAQIRRQKMIYHCKFGEFGILEGQFTEPSGVAVTEENEIIVADTNNHRIQVFDKEGNFQFQFGEVGKRDGQLLYPNRVAVVAKTGDIVVTERSPTHQVQIFTKYGQFIRKFGADILQHPRGVTTDNCGRIIVVECKVMRVVIFDMVGNVLNKFSCSRFLEFPNGVVVNDSMEIFISDNRAHCVKVFDYQGNYLRQIGGEGVSNFPIGVGLTASGEICIADNHNNFNLTVFSQAGQLLGALESKVKHAQCFDVALMKDGSIVLASKDYRLYIYRYVKIPNLSL